MSLPPTMSSSPSTSASTPAPSTPIPPTPASSALTLARAHLARTYKASSSLSGVHAVSFQPLPAKPNQDRVSTLRWTIAGQQWLFLAVCDGHAGDATAEYTARRLPGRIHAALSALPPADLAPSALVPSIPPSAPTTPSSGTSEPTPAASAVSALLTHEVEAFDRHIGRAVRKLVPDPDALSDADIARIVAEHSDVLLRAHHGTTLAAALVHLSARVAWAVGVGDSTVALTTTVPSSSSSSSSSSSPITERLNEHHSPTNPREYFRIAMTHPGTSELAILRATNRVLGAISLTRALGDFGMKLPRAYLARVLVHLPTTAHPEHVANILEHLRSPPYLSATPSVRFVDLRTVWDREPAVVVFSDGVDALVDGETVFRPHDPSDADPVAVVAALLQQPQPRRDGKEAGEGERLGGELDLGHPVQRRWHANRAVDVLGNLVGGTDVVRLARILGRAPPEPTRKGEEAAAAAFRVDDTSIVVCDLREAADGAGV